ncbi:hypothetical protein OIE66_05360 [Nonomuraea sp. NBC_01738]|uniref:hypothetical protein n=1 Tax=Nonomuraea sp. NBC_01738 TaxID=2976003 RepID=UPI002E14A847|nr:hypothetical protein OIE66_05360 [Nonomuraea sp. NBC_01738]
MAAIHTLLTGLARERATGSLSVTPSGKVFVDDGRVTFLECAGTPTVERLLTARGRLGSPRPDTPRALVDGGTVTKAELQFCVVGAVLDAAYFLLPAPMPTARPKFRPGERHWLGGQWGFEVAWLIRECTRRRAALAQTWPVDELDGVPVTPVARPPAQRVTLSALEWQILVSADQVSTPAELAERLGQPAYTVLLAVRRMGSAGLLTVPRLPLRRRHPPERPEPVPRAAPTVDLSVLAAVKKALEELP